MRINYPRSDLRRDEKYRTQPILRQAQDMGFRQRYFSTSLNPLSVISTPHSDRLIQEEVGFFPQAERKSDSPEEHPNLDYFGLND